MNPLLALLLPALAADAPKPASDWDVQAPHGPTRTVSLDLAESTWTHVTVHGDTVVFDLLGDLWSVPLSGGDATRLTSGPAWDTQPAFSPDGTRLAFVSDRGGVENVWQMAADGSDPRPVTEDTDARCTDPVWDPAGEYLLVRRRTVDTRSIGVTELWQRHLDGGAGVRLTSLEEHPHAGEAWAHGPYVWFSSRRGRFQYDQDPVAGLWDVQRLDRRTGEIRPQAWGPGSAARPVVSPDGAALYFVSRQREKTLLEALDLATGERRTVADWLSPDQLEGFALHGTYPRPDWTDDGQLVLWADGRLWRVDPATGARTEIPFRVRGDWTVHEVVRPRLTVEDTVHAKVIRWPTLSSRGSLAFSALGALWVRTPDGETTRIGDGTGYAPAWSPDGRSLAWTSWDDAQGGALHVTGPDGRTETLPVRGQLTNPAWSEDGRELVVLRGVGGGVSPDLADEPWMEIVHLAPAKKKGWTATVVRAIDATWGARRTALRLRDGRVWYTEQREETPRAPATAVLVSVALDGTDRRDHLRLGEAEEVAISPDFTRVAFKRDHQLHVAALPPFARGVEVSAVPSRQVTKIVGDWLGFTPDGAEVTWVEGPVWRRMPLAGVFDVPEAGEQDGEEAPADPFAEDPRIVSEPITLALPRARPEGVTVLQGARVITMRGDEVLDGVNVVIDRDRIVEIAPGATRPGARVIDVTGRTVMPGLVDVHAHLHFSAGDILPEQEWRYLTALDFGVTTVHDPSTITDLVFTQRERVEAGFAKGPRIWSTGGVLYGALSADAADTPDLDAARAHLRRLKAVGATSVKVYQQPWRSQRQWYAQACVEEGMLCVPEGGGDLFMDLGMVVDGYPALEHALPVSPVHDDVIALFAAATGDGLGTFYTPTLQVAYGGLSGKHWFAQHGNPVDDPRLRRHTPPRLLEAAFWRLSVAARDTDWRFRSVAADAARLREAGVHVTLGAHGELQGLGVHWELWALGGPGGLSAHDALRAATLEGARYLGLDAEIGSVEVGKLADLLVLDGDPLVDLRHTVDLVGVVKNGEWFE